MREVLASSRPFSWINTAYPFAAGMLVATQGVLDVVGWVMVVVGTVFFLVPYNLLMYGVNDVFDYASDVANPRKGGIEGGVVAPERAVRVHRRILVSSAVAVVPFVVVLLVLGSGGRLGGVPPWPSLTLLLVVFGVIAYSAPELRFKERPVLDSFTSAMHFVGPLLYALVLVGAPLTARTTWPVLVAFVLWGMASHAFGAVQDVRADRAAHIASVATALGARVTVLLAVGAYLVASAVLLVLPWPGWLAALVPLAYAANAARFRDVRDDDCERANVGWRLFLRLNLVSGAFVTILLLLANR